MLTIVKIELITMSQWPGTIMYFWWLTRAPNFDRYLQRVGSVNVATVEKHKRLLKLPIFLMGVV